VRWLPMVEVHLMRGVSEAAVRARTATKFAEEGHCRGLALADPLQLPIAVPLVVRHVGRPLASCRHAPG
jgi:hypothetical protein